MVLIVPRTKPARYRSAPGDEQAIELNGAAVDMNLQAFRRGRQFVYDRAGLEAALVARSGTTATPLSPLGVPDPTARTPASRPCPAQACVCHEL